MLRNVLLFLLGSASVFAQPDPALTDAPQAAAWRASMADLVSPDVSLAARTVDDFNMTLLGTLRPVDERYGDIWGWVDPATDREYALLTARDDGLFVIDVTDDEPVQTGFVPGLAAGSRLDAKDVKTYGSYAYLVNERAPVQIIDLTDPTAPTQVGTLDVQPGLFEGGSHNIFVEGDYLYVIGGRSPGGLRIYSLEDPTAPAFVGGIAGLDSQTYYHDVEIVGDVLYAAAIYDKGIDILDISDKANPTVTSNFQYAAVNQGAHNVCATEDGSHVFVGDEIGSERHTRGFDVRDPFDVEQVSTIIINPNPNQPVHNCYVLDDLLYIAAYADGVRVYDVTDPGEPEPVAAYDTYLGTETGFRGAWTIYPYLPSGRLIVSDKDTGLYVLRLGEPPVDAEEDAAPAEAFALRASYPNPTTGITTIPFSLGDAADVRLAVYDVLGREVAVLIDGIMPAGDHTVMFDARGAPSGAYVARLRVAGTTQTRPLTLLR